MSEDPCLERHSTHFLANARTKCVVSSRPPQEAEQACEVVYLSAVHRHIVVVVVLLLLSDQLTTPFTVASSSSSPLYLTSAIKLSPYGRPVVLTLITSKEAGIGLAKMTFPPEELVSASWSARARPMVAASDEPLSGRHIRNEANLDRPGRTQSRRGESR